MLVTVDEAQVERGPGLGDPLQQRPLLDAVAAPDAGDEEHLDVAHEPLDEAALLGREPHLVVDPAPVVGPLRVGAQVGLPVQGGVELGSEGLRVHVSSVHPPSASAALSGPRCFSKLRYRPTELE